MAYIVFFFSIVLKLSFSTAGILQLNQLLNSDSNFIFEFLGIDTVAIWNIRVFNSGIALVLIPPMFFSKLLQAKIPKYHKI
jgi:hypothetical protein